MFDENAAIPMDGTPVIYEDENALIPAGEYTFRVLTVKRVNEEARGKMPAHVNIKFKMQLFTLEGASAGVAWDNIRMYMRFMWKYAEFAKCIGQTPPGDNQIRLNWSQAEGAEGRVRVSMREWKRQDGTTEQQNDFKYLVPGAAVAAPRPVAVDPHYAPPVQAPATPAPAQAAPNDDIPF